MNEVPPGRPVAITFDRADEGGGLPVALGAEAVAVGHQALDGEARELLEAVQVLEGVGEGGEAALLEEGAQAHLDPGLPAHGWPCWSFAALTS